MPVTIGSFSYIPPLPVESVVKERITEIAGQEKTAIDVVIELCLYCMKTQVFLDGNKRASVIFANHYLIGHGMGVLVIPEKEVPKFKKLLVAFYGGEYCYNICFYERAVLEEFLIFRLTWILLISFTHGEPPSAAVKRAGKV